MTDATTLTRDLGGKWLRSYGTAPCPCCQPERRRDQNALSISDGADGRLLMHCHKSACTFTDIATAAGIRSGDYRPPDPAIIARREREERAQAEKRARQARAVWGEARPIGGTIAETYLRARGITCDLRDTLRFHPECWHGPTAKRHPALVALVEGADGFAIHRTYLAPDGTDKAGLDGGDKLMLGSTAGGAVQLTDEAGPLAVAEGIETALSLASGLLGRPATVWATLSASGMRGLRLPPSPGRITIATDGDPAGADAGRYLASRAHAFGWQVSMLPAPRDKDWNDILVGRAVMA